MQLSFYMNSKQTKWQLSVVNFETGLSRWVWLRGRKHRACVGVKEPEYFRNSSSPWLDFLLSCLNFSDWSIKDFAFESTQWYVGLKICFRHGQVDEMTISYVES